MSCTQQQACNWGTLSVDETKVILSRNECEPIFEVSQSDIGQCTIFRNDVKLQLKKHPSEFRSKQKDQMFDIEPFEIKFAVPQDGDAVSPDLVSAKSILEKISSYSEKASAMDSGSSSAKDTSGTELLKMCPVTLSSPYGSFQLTVTSSSLIFYKERKTTATEELNQTHFTVPLSSIYLSFMLPFPVSSESAKENIVHARKYLVLCLAEPIQVKSAKHTYIVFTFEDDDVYTPESPLNTSITSLNEVATIFKEKVGKEDAIYTQNSSSVMLVGAKNEIFGKILKGLTGVKILGQSSFQNASYSLEFVSPYIKCSHRSSNGHLYFLEKYFLFLSKPTLLESLGDIEKCSIQMETSCAKTFLLCFEMKSQNSISVKRVLKFSSVASEQVQNLRSWLSTKKVPMNEENIIDDDAEVESPDSLSD